jgi:hypothetical protein
MGKKPQNALTLGKAAQRKVMEFKRIGAERPIASGITAPERIQAIYDAMQEYKKTHPDVVCTELKSIRDLPPGWKVESWGGPVTAFYARTDGLRVMVSANIESDGEYYLHVSYSRKSRMPDYEDTRMVREIFIPSDWEAYMVFPKKSKHISLHPYCLHLYSAKSGPRLPDFSHGLGAI